ncbi:MAG: SH3 domain-containing protein [Clostridia bacterium]|nr:SH3 domain-containing protein [Clostridia bacterium]
MQIGIRRRWMMTDRKRSICAHTATVDLERDRLAMHAKPTEGAPVLAQVADGEPLTVLASRGGWYFVRHGQVEGYVHADYITLNY